MERKKKDREGDEVEVEFFLFFFFVLDPFDLQMLLFFALNSPDPFLSTPSIQRDSCHVALRLV